MTATEVGVEAGFNETMAARPDRELIAVYGICWHCGAARLAVLADTDGAASLQVTCRNGHDW